MARSSGGSAGAVVAGLTAAALAVIGFFAYQANAAQDRVASEQPRSSVSSSHSGHDDTGSDKATLPVKSGKGERVVYALGRRRVWLVGPHEKVQRTFRVGPSTVSPPPGVYKVQSRSAHVTGSDGVPVENVVRFATVDGTTIGFSAALDGSMPETGATNTAKKTGGVREHRKDGEAMWLFAPIGTKVVVVH